MPEIGLKSKIAFPCFSDWTEVKIAFTAFGATNNVIKNDIVK